MAYAVKPKGGFFFKFKEVFYISDFLIFKLYVAFCFTPVYFGVLHIKSVCFFYICNITIRFIGKPAKIHCLVFQSQFYFILKVNYFHHNVVGEQAFRVIAVHNGVACMYSAAGRAKNLYRTAVPSYIWFYGKHCTAVYATCLIVTITVITPAFSVIFMYYKQCGRTIVLVHCVAYYHISDYKFSKFFHLSHLHSSSSSSKA